MPDNNQLELFSQSNGSSAVRARSADASLVTYIRQYEKRILIIIGIIFTSIVSFSLGVEQGRKISQPTVPVTSAVSIQAPKAGQLPRRLEVAPQQQNLIEDQKIQESIGGYTIQIASYKFKKSAQNEVQALKKRGLTPILLSKGTYTVLCVGNFPSKKEAQTMLSEFKKRYAGCYIRRL